MSHSAKAKIAFTLAIYLLLAASTSFAASTSLQISAVILSKSLCKINTKSALLNFGNLNPVAPADVTRTATLEFVCNGSSPTAVFSFHDDDGLHESGPNANRMQHSTLGTAYLPYTFNYAPQNGSIPKGVAQKLTITGTILGGDYQTAPAGIYTDTVQITILP